jgi:hypothetical protein
MSWDYENVTVSKIKYRGRVFRPGLGVALEK